MKQPQVIDKTDAEIATIISLIKESVLPDSVKEFAIKCIELAIWLPIQIQQKTISLSRLRKMLFGNGYSKNKKNSLSTNKSHVHTKTGTQNESNESTEQDLQKSTQNSEEVALKEKPGHGRMPHTVYQDYTEIKLTIDGINMGDLCPQACGGTLRYYNPGILVRISGQNFADVKKYFVDKLRCDLCGLLVSAKLPPEVGDEKYDASFKAMLVLQKYYAGMPFYLLLEVASSFFNI